LYCSSTAYVGLVVLDTIAQKMKPLPGLVTQQPTSFLQNPDQPLMSKSKKN
jgi:hypothetical protein